MHCLLQTVKVGKRKFGDRSEKVCVVRAVLSYVSTVAKKGAGASARRRAAFFGRSTKHVSASRQLADNLICEAVDYIWDGSR